jgi:uncharacterized protein
LITLYEENLEDYMEFAVNYSRPLVALLQSGRITLDRFKCPAWPQAVAEAQAIHPCYVHLPLSVGRGIGQAIDTETKQPADWHKMESLLAQTDTPFVNLHLEARAAVYPDLAYDTTHPVDLDRIIENIVRDVTAVVNRFGPERVTVENLHGHAQTYLQAAYLPPVISAVVEATNCGLLLDISHARLAAYQLGWDAYDYINALPLTAVREIHVTGVQRLDAYWLNQLAAAGANLDTFAPFAGEPIDHLPMTESDWPFLAWALAEIEAGRWGRPSIAAYEYGGIGAVYEAITNGETLAAQLPRMYEMVKTQLVPGTAAITSWSSR